MNTWVWGPPAWRVLHTLSGKVDSADKRRNFDSLLQSLRGALPCVYCRASWTDFLRRADDRDPVKRLYDLHNLVSDKLHRQHWESVASRGPYVPPRRPTLQCLRVKLATTMRSVCMQDVWSHLEIFAFGSGLNAEGRKAFGRYCRALGALLVSCGQPCGRQVLGLASTAEACEEPWRPKQALVSVWIARGLAEKGTRLPMNPAEFDQLWSCISSVQARACQKGSCV